MSTQPDEKTAAAPSSVEDKFYPKHTGAKSAPPPEDKSSETPVQTGAVQTEAAPEPADTDPEPLVEEADKPKSPRSSWAEMRQARYRAEARAELLEKELAEQRKAASLPAKPLTDDKPAIDLDKPLDAADYPTYEAYLDER